MTNKSTRSPTETPRVSSKHQQRAPNGVDVLVGQRMRARRMMTGLSQQELGDRLDISFQQVQKYEKGQNRISASKLHQIAVALNVPVHFFFQTVGEHQAVEEDGILTLLKDRDAISLLHAFTQIRDRNVRRAILDHVRNLAAIMDEQASETVD